MFENKVVPFRQKDEIDDPLTEILRAGAKRLIEQAVEAEFAAFLASHGDLKLPDGRRRVVRHGHDPVRPIQKGIGPVEVEKPKARDRGASSAKERIRYSSSILPKWALRTKSLDVLLPALYLRGISTGDFQEVLTALLGKDAPDLSPAVIARLKGEWEDEYKLWQKRDLSARSYVYVWADGVYLQARMEPQAECMLVLIGATRRGQEGAARLSDGHAGERAKLEGTARRFEGARPFDRPGNRRWRRRAGVLEGSRRSIPVDAPSTLLAAQDAECSRQAAEVRAAQRARRLTRNLVVAEPGGGGSRHDDLRREICAQIPKSRRLLAQGPRRAADILRFSRRAYVDGPMASVFFALNDLVGCGHMSGLSVRHIRPLALMKSDALDPYHWSELCAHAQRQGVPGIRSQPCRPSRFDALAKLEAQAP